MSQALYKVLIVEDTRELGEIIQMVLEKHGIFDIFLEEDGQTAIERFSTIKPDLVLLDLNLPDMRGWHVLDEMRTIAQEIELEMPKVIVTTAYSDAANRVTGKFQNIGSYLVKPFRPSEVEQAVLESLGIELSQ